MKKQFIGMAAILFAVSCSEASIDTSIDANNTKNEISVSVSSPSDTQSRVSISPDVNNEVWSVNWVDGDLLGACSSGAIDCLTLEEGAGSASGSFSGSTSAESLRLIYPYDAIAMSGNICTIDITNQYCSMDDTFEALAKSSIMVSDEIINDSNSTASMKHVAAAMQFNVTFTDLDEASAYELASIKLCGVPTTVAIDITDASTSTTSGDLNINVKEGTTLVEGEQYTINATILPFELAANESISIELMLRETTASGTVRYVKRTIVKTPTEAISFEKGLHHYLTIECEVGNTSSYLFYSDVTLSGRSAYGGTDEAFFDAETGEMYTPDEVLGYQSVIDFFVCDFTKHIRLCSPTASATPMGLYYTTDGTQFTTDATVWSGGTPKFRALDATDAAQAALIAAFEDGTIAFDAASIAANVANGIATPTNTNMSIGAVDGDYVDVGTYIYIYNQATGVYGLMKTKSITTGTGNYVVDLTFDLAWGERDETYYNFNEDNGNDTYFRYEGISMSGRSEDGGTNEAFIDCETGVVYNTCNATALADPSILDFMIHGANVNGGSGTAEPCSSLQSPSTSASFLKNYNCNGVAIYNADTNPDWGNIFMTTVTMFRAIDVDSAAGSAIVDAFDNDTFTFDLLDALSAPAATAPYVYPSQTAFSSKYTGNRFSLDKYCYGYIKNNTTGKRGVIKYTDLSNLSTDGTKYIDVTFDLIWEK